MLYAGIEAGGTKFVCAVADENLTIHKKVSIPTTTPEETLSQVFAFFDAYELRAIGIGSFGPIGINKAKSDYGFILDTPKKGWEHFDLLGSIKNHYQLPVAWTTDVNAAAYGEAEWGAAKGKNSCLYLTVGTGIGGGIVVDGRIYEGVTHPEVGHIPVKRHPEDHYSGFCPYHGDCLEGLAAGPSLESRTGIKGQALPLDHPVWDIQAYYLAQALVTYTLTFSPEIIILGGGVMNQDHLLEKIRQTYLKVMGGYIKIDDVASYIVRWGLPNESGIRGTLLMAKNLAE